MSLRFYKTRVLARFDVEVEAESADEAARIIDGVLDNATSIIVFENTDETEDQLNGCGKFNFNRGQLQRSEEWTDWPPEV